MACSSRNYFGWGGRVGLRSKPNEKISREDPLDSKPKGGREIGAAKGAKVS
jgi:hypothetical protein